MFLDGDSVDSYGKLVSWGEDEKALDYLFTRLHFTPGDGLRVFEIQQRIYPFLVKCCELILHDLVEAGSLLDTPIIEPESVSAVQMADLAIEPETVPPAGEILPTLASISAEAPYRLPANLHFNRLKSIIAAKRSAAEDHIWALREDPGYFAETIIDWSEHRNDPLADTMGNPHPTGPHTVEFWERVIRNAIADAYSGFMNWDLLLRHVNRLITLQEKFKDQISYEKQFPKEYLIALLKFKQLLLVNCETPIFYLRNIQSSPPLRHHFVREPQRPGTVNMMTQPRNLNDPFFHKPWGILLTLWDAEQRQLFGVTKLIDAFEQLIQDPQEKKNMSPYILGLFADLSVLTRALHEIEIYQPWAATFEDENEQHSREVSGLFEEAKYTMEWMEHMDYVLKGIAELAMPKDEKFYYPTDKKRTSQTTDAMIKAERNLDLFWSRYNLNWKRIARKTVDASMGDHIPSHRGQPLARTAPWVEPRKELKAPQEPRGPPKDPDGSFGAGSGTKDQKPEPKQQKLKTKGVGKSKEKDNQQKNNNNPPSSQVSPQPLFRVDKRSLKVVRVLFHVPNQNDKPGEIPWNDFLHLMTSAGFAVQKLYGSIWQFSPVHAGLERSILFHEPHPEVRIQFVIARRMGRRLNRAYRWESGCFALEIVFFGIE
ncbi:Uncharacterized protein BP5553_03253 [Venustampulla echinocandica]|uniref:Uncharacterized protein n=1 Tax=Venustampulla echinocandica TaxID=2656787 RepID=A0A370TTS2_9HELO|nr:Uncharacterized protein BP5553_03253 [Venustampulla echinocandica]RDL38913.1 Uncharacterized protein BP5553_03253 [Venustampulla echinocandica]